MSFLANSAFLNMLGWALINSIWQFGICWFAYRLLIAGTDKVPPAVKHSAALFLLFSGGVIFLLECIWKYNSGDLTMGGSAVLNIDNSILFNSLHMAGNYANTLMPYWSLIYLGCIVLLFIKLAFFVRQTGRLHQRGVSRISAQWRIYIQDISAQLAITKDIKAFLSVQIDTPQVIGFLKPVILLPAACITQLSTAQLEAVLLHELVHIQRNDYMVNLVIATLEILFFFNPFVKQLTSAIRKEREYSCDDTVMQFKYQPQQYAAALLTLEKNRLTPVTYGIAASGKNEKQLLTRIERIVGIKNKPVRMYKAGAALVVLLFASLLLIVHPSPVALNMLDAGPLAFADNSPGTPPHSTENKEIIRAIAGSKKASPAKPSTITITLNRPSVARVSITAPPALADTFSAVFADDTNADGDNVVAINNKENRDFSIGQGELTGAMAAPEPARAEEPFVPANSFSFRIVQDSSIPKIKGETYAERKAREALYNAQRALTQLNWQKIEKDLKSQPRILEKLKKELYQQLQSLNWRQINADVQNQLEQQQLETVQEALSQQQAVKEYQQTEVYYETLKRRIAAQEQALRMSDLRIKETQKAVDEKQKNLVREMVKRRIIYI